MPDAAEQFRRDLLDAVTADAAATRTGNPNAVRVRARRRRRARGLLTVTMVLSIAAGAAATFGLPDRDDPVPDRLANGDVAAPFVLEEGTASDGPWTLVVTEQACIEHTRRSGQGGACGFADPGRLQEASSFRTEDDGEALVVVNGPVPDGASEVTIELADRPPVQVIPVSVDGRLFFSARAPADARITGLVAVDESGEVLDRLEELPPPPP